jgi:beta-barrel assembly-enhancing protease
MTGFEVKYYSGKNSVSNTALLNFHEKKWVLTYTNSFTGEPEEITWDLDKIHNAQILSTITVFKYGEFPHQSIEYKDDALTKKIRAKYPERLFDSTDVFIHTMNFKKLALVFSTIIVFLACFYYFLLPIAVVHVVEALPTSYDAELGERVYEQMAETLEIDTVETDLVNEYASKIDFNTTFDLKIHVVKGDIVNAFALPGGHIVIYEGILKKMKHKEELAALLAHEVSHVNHRHSMKSIAKSLSSYLFLSVVTSDVNGIISIIANNADMFNSLTYSRELETEADTEGLKILYDNQIDQHGFVYLFETLNEEGASAMNIELLSTHPLTENRIANATDEAAKQTNVQYRGDLAEVWRIIQSRLQFSTNAE